MKKTNKKGFTIVELVIVIAVIAILAAVLIPTFTNVVEKANLSNARQAGRNAYTIALAEELADGDYDANTYYVKGNTISTSEVTGYDFKIVFTAEGAVTITGNSSSYNGYTYTVTDGVYDCVKTTTSSASETPAVGG